MGFKNHVELLELGHVVSATSVRHTTHVVLCSCAAAKVRPQRAGSSFALLHLHERLGFRLVAAGNETGSYVIDL